MVMAPATSTKLTYEDYLLLPEDGRRHEIIDGEHYVTPAPLFRHQQIALSLAYAFRTHLAPSRAGVVIVAPFDVVLSESDVVQPDVMFVRTERRHIIRPKNIDGAPDLVIEILSESSRQRDLTIKRKLYESAGVAEYWLVDPDDERVTIYRREAGTFLPRDAGDVITTPLLPGFTLPRADVFAMP